MSSVLDFLSQIGVDNIRYQNLDDTLTEMNCKDGYSEFSFGSDQPFTLNGPGDMGLVLWLPRDKVPAAKEAAELRGKMANPRADLLEEVLRRHGICPKCLEAPEHSLDEPTSTCRCGTGEDYGRRPMQELQRLRDSLNRINSAVECNYPAVENLTDSEAKETLVNLCKMILEGRDRDR